MKPNTGNSCSRFVDACHCQACWTWRELSSNVWHDGRITIYEHVEEGVDLTGVQNSALTARFNERFVGTRSPSHMLFKAAASIKWCICIQQIIRNRLHEVRLRARQPATLFLLNDRHTTARLDWCPCYRNWINKKHQVFFTDESHFSVLTNDDRGRVWRLPVRRHLTTYVVEIQTASTMGIIIWRSNDSW